MVKTISHWSLVIGHWSLVIGHCPNPQSPIPNPHSHLLKITGSTPLSFRKAQNLG
ncbi:MAG: hypothetical protein V7L23_23325 [Nostoc sp.]|uniref:hypothetical protein n=1 Tax=Nostoc sp. TaxID=1180 RepID=UPI002FF055A4